MNVLGLLAVAVWAMLPAYVPNNAAVLAGGGRPIDGGRTMGGRRLLGDGKTWRGTAVGIIAGLLIAALLNAIHPVATSRLGAALPPFQPLAALGLAAGAMAGDIAASFLKRRLGRERGAAAPLLDQLDFVVGALVLTAVMAPGWFTTVFTLPVVLTVLVATPVFHVLTNGLAYLLGLKSEPY
ncbi:MAG: CDP-2,3-bis-(O-geranylgeranyl)-sn-glycerol synthase [Halanaeroarchaeum sp.]